MIYAALGEDFTALRDGLAPGLVGTLTVQIEDLAGATIVGPTVDGIAEVEPTVYAATLTANVASTGEYAFVWTTPTGTRYAETLLVSRSSVAQIRTKIGDTDAADQLLADGEIEDVIARWPDNPDLAAADAAEAIAAKFARDYTFATGDQTFNRRERVVHYMDLAETLRARGGSLVWPSPS